MYLLFLAVSAVSSTGNDALFQIQHFCASYHTIADYSDQLRGQLLAIVDKLDADSQKTPDHLDWEMHEDRIIDLLEESGAEFDSDHDFPQVEALVKDKEDTELIEERHCPSELGTPQADQDGLVLEAAAEEELVQATPTSAPEEEQQASLLVEETAAPSAAVEGLVGEVTPKEAVVVETSSDSQEVFERPTEEEAPEPPTQRDSLKENSSPAPAAPLTLAETIALAKTLLARRLASADEQLLTELEAVLSNFPSNKKMKMMNVDARKTKTSVQIRIDEVKQALLIRDFHQHEQLLLTVTVQTNAVFARVQEAKVTEADLQIVMSAAKELEELMKVDKTKFEPLGLPIGELTDKATRLFLEIVHLGVFEIGDMPTSLFVPFSDLQRLVTGIQYYTRALLDDLVQRPLTQAIGAPFDAQTLRARELLVGDCIKLVEAHAAKSRMYEERQSPSQRLPSLLRFDRTSIRYYRQIVHGAISFKDAISTLVEANKLYSQTLDELRDNSTNGHLLQLPVIKVNVAAAYATLLVHPHSQSQAELLAEPGAVPALQSARNIIDDLSNCDVVDQPLVDKLKSIAEVASHKGHSIPELRNILRRVQLLAFYGFTQGQQERSAFLRNLTKVRNNLIEARKAASSGKMI